MSVALVEQEIQALVGFGVEAGIVADGEADDWVASLWEANCQAIRERYRDTAERLFPRIIGPTPKFGAVTSGHINVAGDTYWYQVSQQPGWEGSIAEARTAAILYAIAASTAPDI